MSLNFDQFDDYEFDEHPFMRVDPDNGLYVGDRLLRHATVIRGRNPMDWVEGAWARPEGRPNAHVVTLSEQAFVPLENGRSASIAWHRSHRDNYGDLSTPGLDWVGDWQDRAQVHPSLITSGSAPGGVDKHDWGAVMSDRSRMLSAIRRTPEAVMEGIAEVGSLRPPESVRRGERPEPFELHSLRETYRRQAEGKPDPRHEDIVYDPMNRRNRR